MKALLISGLTLALLTGGAFAAGGRPASRAARSRRGGPAAATCAAARGHCERRRLRRRPRLAQRRPSASRRPGSRGTTWTALRRLHPAAPVLAVSGRRRLPGLRIFACSAATQ